MAFIEDITPTDQILDDDGRDWTWTYVLFAEILDAPGYRCDTSGNLWTEWNQVGYQKWDRTGKWRKLRLNPNQAGHLYSSIKTNDGSRCVYAHNLVLTLFRGPRPEGKEACHRNDIQSDNRLHNLRWDTHVANLEDAEENGKRRKGTAINTAKLTEADIVEIRRMLTEKNSLRKIASWFGVTMQTISAIGHGKTWSHVPGTEDTKMNPPGTVAKGEDHCQAKLTEDLVREIRRRFAAGEASMGQMAREIGVTVSVVHAAIHRKSWKHVE